MEQKNISDRVNEKEEGWGLVPTRPQKGENAAFVGERRSLSEKSVKGK